MAILMVMMIYRGATRFFDMSIGNYWLVWNMAFIFPYIGNSNPNWLIFFRGVETTNQITLYTYMQVTVHDPHIVYSWCVFSGFRSLASQRLKNRCLGSE